MEMFEGKLAASTEEVEYPVTERSVKSSTSVQKQSTVYNCSGYVVLKYSHVAFA